MNQNLIVRQLPIFFQRAHVPFRPSTNCPRHIQRRRIHIRSRGRPSFICNFPRFNFLHQTFQLRCHLGLQNPVSILHITLQIFGQRCQLSHQRNQILLNHPQILSHKLLRRRRPRQSNRRIQLIHGAVGLPPPPGGPPTPPTCYTPSHSPLLSL